MFLIFGSLYFLCGTVRPQKQETTNKKLSLSFLLEIPRFIRNLFWPSFNYFISYIWVLIFLCFLYFFSDTVGHRKQDTPSKKLIRNFFVLNTPDYKKPFSLPLTILFLIFGSLYFLCGTVRPRKQETTNKKLSLSFLLEIPRIIRNLFWPSFNYFISYIWVLIFLCFLYFFSGTVGHRKQDTPSKKLIRNFFVLNTPDYKKQFSLPLTILFFIFGSLYFLCFLYFLCGTVRPRKQETTNEKHSPSFFGLNTQDYKKPFSLRLTILFLIFGSLYFLCFLYFLCGTVRSRKQETTCKKLSLSRTTMGFLLLLVCIGTP